MAHLSVVYRLDPTQQQEAQMLGFAAACRMVWNAALEQRQTAWSRCRASVSFAAQSAEVKDVRAAFPFLARVPANILHATLRDLDRAYKNWWADRARSPRWKSAKRTAPSFRLTVTGAAVLATGRHVRIAKIGRVRAHISRGLPGRIQRATITRRHGHWYISFSCEVQAPSPAVHSGPSVGVDLGIANTVTLSSGEMLDMPVPTPADWHRLARLQRRLARRRRGSRGSKQAHRSIGRWYERHGNVRTDFIAKTAHRLTEQFSLIAVEDLAVQQMTRRARGRGRRAKAGLNRALLLRAFGTLRTRIEQKAKWTGSEVIAVDPRYTSQTCSSCGHVARENRESQAVFRCVACLYECHADVNAAINILSRATAGLAENHAGGAGGLEGPALNSEPYTTSKEASYVQ